MRAYAILASAVVLLTACGDRISPVAPELEPQANLAPAAATTFTESTRVDFAEVVAIPCTVETIALSGTLHLLTHITEDAAGGLHVTTHSNPQGITGIGLATGTLYQGAGVTRETSNVRGPFPATITAVNNFRLISRGPAENFHVHILLHLTVNANGDITAVVENTSIECR